MAMTAVHVGQKEFLLTFPTRLHPQSSAQCALRLWGQVSQINHEPFAGILDLIRVGLSDVHWTDSDEVVLQ